jgi:predicted dehydrogenase
LTLEEAIQLRDKIRDTGLEFCLTHNYTGYPMVKQARDMIRNGEIGDIVKVISEYPQGWLATRLESEDQKQAAWRTDPVRAGCSCCMGDIGSHAENLAEFITGLKITEMCADLTTFVPGRSLDDDGNVLARFNNGARGIIYASQVSIGEENNINIRIYGTQGGLEWHQQEPNTLIVKHIDRPTEILRTGGAGIGARASYNTRTPAGHPEGYLEAFANLYRNFAEVLTARFDGRKPESLATDYPTIDDGVRGMAFIEACVASSNSNVKWFKFPEV